MTERAPLLPDKLWIVPSERHVERWTRLAGAKGDARVETRARLRTRLFDTLVRDRAAATHVEARLALAEALPAVAADDPLLGPLARQGGDGWERTLDVVDAALGTLRAAGIRPESLARVHQAAGAGRTRARALASAMRAADTWLDARALVDPRSVGSLLAERIPTVPAAWVLAAAGARAVVARFVLDWDEGDAGWWRALDAALVRAGGSGARVELPSFEQTIDPSQERGPLEVLIDDVARALDGPPGLLPIDGPLGDLRLTGPLPPRSRTRLESRAAADAEAQARAALDVVRRALVAGVGVESIALTAGALDEGAVAALRRTFDDARIPLHDARGESPLAAGVVGFALRALAAGEGEGALGRLEMAALARSGYLDPERLLATRETLEDLATALERTPSSAAPTVRDALTETARASVAARAGRLAGEDEERALAEGRATLAGRLADAVLRVAHPRTRAGHVAAARALFADLGIDPLRARGAEDALASDEPPKDVQRAELQAVARDAHAWEVLQAALSDYEAASARLDLARPVVSPAAFRHELARTLEARTRRPGAARAGALRIADLAELAGEPLSLLVIFDANDGVLPTRKEGDALLHEGLVGALRTADPSRAPASSSVRVSRELTSLALAVANARAVVFVRRGRDRDGAVLAASPVVAWLERNGVAPAPWRASPLDGPPVNEREAALRRLARGSVRLGAGVQRRARIERTREARFELSSPAADPLLGDLDVGAPLHPELARALVAETGGAQRPLAVTNLEHFAVCAFQGFARQVLRASHERPLRELPDAREAGTLTHRALAAAFTATAPLWSERPRDAARILALAEQATEEVLQQQSVASVLRRLALARVRAGVSAVLAWSLADENWDFVHAEAPFGDRRDAWPPLVLDDGASRVALRGSIDRVDVAHGRAAVRAIDYKTSARAAESGMRELGDTAFQVPLYARAAADALRRPERRGLYLFVQRPGDVGAKVAKEFEGAWNTLHAREKEDRDLTLLEAAAIRVVRRVREGAIAPRPHDESACARCDASGGCRKPRFAIMRDEPEGRG